MGNEILKAELNIMLKPLTVFTLKGWQSRDLAFMRIYHKGEIKIIKIDSIDAECMEGVKWTLAEDDYDLKPLSDILDGYEISEVFKLPYGISSTIYEKVLESLK